jgi:acyl dehydratase
VTLTLAKSWTPTQAGFDAFARISGDDNPIHVDPAFAARTAFGRTVSHGMLIYTQLWAMIVAARPGLRQVRQSMMFPNPAFAGEEIVLNVTGETPGLLQVGAHRAADGAPVLLGETEVTA